jgi:hypothetical protein
MGRVSIVLKLCYVRQRAKNKSTPLFSYIGGPKGEALHLSIDSSIFIFIFLGGGLQPITNYWNKPFANTHMWMGSTPILGICSQWLSLSPHPCLNRSKNTKSFEPTSPRSPYRGATRALLPQLSSSTGFGVTTSPKEFQPISLFFKASICECCSTWLTIKYGMQSRRTCNQKESGKYK